MLPARDRARAQRVYRMYDFTKAQLISLAGKVNSVDKLYLVIESVRPDTKHPRCSNAHAHVDGAGGCLIE